MQPVQTDHAPAPGGHYSQAMVHSGLVFVSGQLPIDPATGEKKTGAMEEQAEQALLNVKAILDAAGSGLDHALQLTIYISDISQWGAVNDVYTRILGARRRPISS